MATAKVEAVLHVKWGALEGLQHGDTRGQDNSSRGHYLLSTPLVIELLELQRN